MDQGAKWLEGTVVAESIKTSLQPRIQALMKKGVTPCLATVLVGDDPGSVTYVRMKGNACKRLGSGKPALPHGPLKPTPAPQAPVHVK